jgi:hypothetical protein
MREQRLHDRQILNAKTVSRAMIRPLSAMRTLRVRYSKK